MRRDPPDTARTTNPVALYRSLRCTPDSSPASTHTHVYTADLDALVAFSMRWLVHGIVHRLLEEHGVLDRLSPAVRMPFEAAVVIAQRREHQMLDQVRAIHRVLSTAGVRYCLLKGAAMIAAGYYPRAGERYVSDIDLLVGSSDLDRALDLFDAAGYRSTYRFDRPVAPYWHSKHLPPLRHPDHPFPVELHQRPLDDTWRHLAILDTDTVLAASRRRDTGPESLSTPSDAHMLLQCFYHTQLYDAAQLAGRDVYRAMEDTVRLLHRQPEPARFIQLECHDALARSRATVSFHRFLDRCAVCVDPDVARLVAPSSTAWPFNGTRSVTRRFPPIGRTAAGLAIHTRELHRILSPRGRRERQVLRRCNPDEWKFRPVIQQLLQPSQLRHRLQYLAAMLKR